MLRNFGLTTYLIILIFRFKIKNLKKSIFFEFFFLLELEIFGGNFEFFWLILYARLTYISLVRFLGPFLAPNYNLKGPKYEIVF